MIVIAGTTHESYTAEITQGSDAVFSASLDGLIDAAPGAIVSLDGDAYQLTDLTWHPGPAPQTRIRAVRARDTAAIIAFLRQALPSLAFVWRSDPVIARLEEMAPDGYGAFILNDIGDAADLPQIARILRQNLFDLYFTGQTATPVTLVPIWHTIGAAIDLAPAQPVSFRRRHELGGGISQADLTASARADAAAAAIAVGVNIQFLLQRAIDAVNAVATAWSNVALPSTNPGWRQVAIGLAGAIQAGGAVFGELVNDAYDSAIADLIRLAAQYDAYLPGAVTARRGMSGVAAAMVSMGAAARGAHGALAGAMEGQHYGARAYRASDFRGERASLRNASALGAAAHAAVAVYVAAAGSQITAAGATTSASAFRAQYTDDSGAVFPFPLRAAPDAQELPDIYPDRYTAIIRVTQANLRRQMSAGEVTLEPDTGATTARQFSRVNADLGLPNGAKAWRVERAIISRHGAIDRVRLDCSQLPGIAAPTAAVPEFGPVDLRLRRAVATQLPHTLGEGRQSLVNIPDMRCRAYAEIGNARLAVRADTPARRIVGMQATPTRDILLIYRGASDEPVNIFVDANRQPTYAAAVVAAQYLTGGAAHDFNASAAGFAILTAGANHYLAAAVAGQVRAAASNYDTIFLSLAPLTPGTFAIGAWTTVALPASNIPVAERAAQPSHHDRAYSPVIVHDGGANIRIYARSTTFRIGGRGIVHIYQATISPQAILRAAARNSVPSADDTVYRSDWTNRWPGAIAGGQTYFAGGQLRPRQGVGFGHLGAAVPSARALYAVSPTELRAVDGQHRVWKIELVPASATAPITIR